jgi:hypothetical protein
MDDHVFSLFWILGEKYLDIATRKKKNSIKATKVLLVLM